MCRFVRVLACPYAHVGGTGSGIEGVGAEMERREREREEERETDNENQGEVMLAWGEKDRDQK